MGSSSPVCRACHYMKASLILFRDATRQDEARHAAAMESINVMLDLAREAILASTRSKKSGTRMAAQSHPGTRFLEILGCHLGWEQ